MRIRTTLGTALLAVGAAVVVATCGGGGGGDGTGNGGGNPTASVTGQVSSVTLPSTAARVSSLDRFVKMVLPVREAFAQSTEASLSGVQVEIASPAGNQSTTTDDSGRFAFPSAPTGDVTINLTAGNCTGPRFLPDIVDNSTVSVTGIDIDCLAGEQPDAMDVHEVFRGVVRSVEVTGEAQSDVHVCVASGGENVERVASTDASTGGGFSLGDLIQVDGTRASTSSFPPSSDVVANSITVVASNQADPCSG